MKKLAEKAERTGREQYGVKGVSILSKYIELPACVPVDYMHSVFEGVMKQLLKRWFDSKYHSHAYSPKEILI